MEVAMVFRSVSAFSFSLFFLRQVLQGRGSETMQAACELLQDDPATSTFPF